MNKLRCSIEIICKYNRQTLQFVNKISQFVNDIINNVNSTQDCRHNYFTNQQHATCTIQNTIQIERTVEYHTGGKTSIIIGFSQSVLH